MALEVEIKKLTDENTDHQKLLQLFDEKECTYKEEIIRLKNQLEEGKKIEEGMRNQYKEKEDQCQRLEDEVASLRNKVNEEDTTTEELKERIG